MQFLMVVEVDRFTMLYDDFTALLLLSLLLLIDWMVALPSMVELSVHGTWKATGIFVAGAGRMMGSAAVYCQYCRIRVR